MKKRTKEEAIEKIRWCIQMFDSPFVCGVIRYLFVQVRSDKTFQRFEVYEKKTRKMLEKWKRLRTCTVRKSCSWSLSLSPSLQKES